MTVVEEIAVRVREQNGAALIIDYGEEGTNKYTFRVHKILNLLFYIFLLGI